MSMIRLRNIEKYYILGSKKIEIFKGMHFEANEGDIVIITGNSGSGKSTLLNIISGMDKAQGGMISVSGFDVKNTKEEDLTEYRLKKIGFVFQAHYLLDEFSALENVMIPALMLGVKKNDAKILAFKLLKQVGLEERSNHFPIELSGGERQRVAIARALMNNPDIILADEPTGNLDRENAKIIQELLFSLVKEKKKTLILVTHDLDLVKYATKHYYYENKYFICPQAPYLFYSDDTHIKPVEDEHE